MKPADPPGATAPALELDGYLAAFECAAVGGREPDPAAFLPPAHPPPYPAVLRDPLRVDMEFAWGRGPRRRVEDYRERFPGLADDPAAVRDLALEEYRLRK